MTDPDRKPVLVIGFDGVLHTAASGWQGPGVVVDPPVPGALAFLEAASEHFDIAIFSSRSSHPAGLMAMRNWLWFHAIGRYPDVRGDDESVPAWLRAIAWPTEKPPAFVTIDDRAITFEGTWPEIDDLLAFRPWNRRGES